LATACTDDVEPESGATYATRDSAGIIIVENQRPSLPRMWTVAASPSLRVGHESGRPEQELYRVVSAIRLSDGTVVIGNGGTNEVRWYSDSGALLRSSGGVGEGPEEFRQLDRVIRLGGDSIGAGDYVLARLTVYDANGNFVRTVTQRAVEGQILGPVARFSDGTLLWAPSGFALSGQGPTRIERMTMSVYRSDASGGSAELVASLPWIEHVVAPGGGVRPDGTEVIGRNPRAFGRSSWVVADADGWIFADNAVPEIRVHAISGLVAKVVRWQATPRLVTEADVQRDADWDDARMSQREPAARARIRRAREAHPPPPDTMPWFGCPAIRCPGRAVLLDADRNLWVREYRPPAEGVSNRYEVFDSAGVWLGAVDVPEGLEVLSIGSDHVVGRMRDELDVESVAVHRIVKG
jgi:hypothetical protein